MKKKRTLISLISLALVMVVGIAFAAVTRNLSIMGNVNVKANTDAFKVEFVSEDSHVTLSDDKGTATITINDNNNYTELTQVGQSVTVNLSIKNASTDKYDAQVGEATISKVKLDGQEADNISVTTTWTAQTVAYGTEKAFTVTITLDKALLEAASFSFTITFEATPVPSAVGA